MAEQLAQALRGTQGDAEVPALTPLREVRIERRSFGHHRVAQWLEQPAQESVAAPARQDGDMRLERNRLRHQVRTLLALALEGAAEHTRDRDAQERRGDVGPVVDVLLQQAALAFGPSLAADEPDRVDVEQERRRAALSRGLGIEDVHSSQRQVERLRPSRVLVQQEPKVRRRALRRCHLEQHFIRPRSPRSIRHVAS